AGIARNVEGLPGISFKNHTVLAFHKFAIAQADPLREPSWFRLLQTVIPMICIWVLRKRDVGTGFSKPFNICAAGADWDPVVGDSVKQPDRLACTRSMHFGTGRV